MKTEHLRIKRLGILMILNTQNHENPIIPKNHGSDNQ